MALAISVAAGIRCAINYRPRVVDPIASAAGVKNASKPRRAIVTNATDTAVGWSVDGSGGGNAQVGTVSSRGLYTAPQSPGTHTVTAQYNGGNPNFASSNTASLIEWTASGGASGWCSRPGRGSRPRCRCAGTPCGCGRRTGASSRRSRGTAPRRRRRQPVITIVPISGRNIVCATCSRRSLVMHNGARNEPATGR